jgi:uncharacterized membrane protein HdeD (DUF308 family)
LFACYAIADGLTLVLVSDLSGGRWWAALLNGIVSILAGAAFALECQAAITRCRVT